jgi:hypothetical protein
VSSNHSSTSYASSSAQKSCALSYKKRRKNCWYRTRTWTERIHNSWIRNDDKDTVKNASPANTLDTADEYDNDDPDEQHTSNVAWNTLATINSCIEMYLEKRWRRRRSSLPSYGSFKKKNFRPLWITERHYICSTVFYIKFGISEMLDGQRQQCTTHNTDTYILCWGKWFLFYADLI